MSISNRTCYYSLKIEQDHRTKDETLCDFCDGTYFRDHPLFSASPHSLQVFLYYDDVELCNPLGSKRKIHKIG